MLFKEKSYDRAEALYRQIVEREPRNVDGLTSLALCLKHKCILENKSTMDKSTMDKPEVLWGQVCALYQEALRVDSQDVEANFGLAMANLQKPGSPDFNQALLYFQQAVKKDRPS